MASTASQQAPPVGPNGPAASNNTRRHRPRRRPNQTQNPDEGTARDQTRQQQPRRGGGGSGRGGSRLVPMTVAPDQSTASNARSVGSEQAPRGRGRGGRTRGSRPVQNASRTNGRTFGGQLTEELNTELSADAPAFVPGQARPHAPMKAPARRGSKSVAPDIMTRIHEDIDNHEYECAVCFSEVLRNSRVWSCRTCWAVFHLPCVKKWATSAAADAKEESAAKIWRCPACNLPKDTLPTSFNCWCGKEHEPRSIPGLPPFSCGQTCSQEHLLPKPCPHPCSLSCHAGPCPPCTQMGPTQPCFCGKEATTRRCVDTQYGTLWSCRQVCGRRMSCGEHACSRPCHEGPCGSCEVLVEARCYCGKSEQAIQCQHRSDPLPSNIHHGTESGSTKEEWIGQFDCGSSCERTFYCGVHSCSKRCHPQDELPLPCPQSPDVVKHCQCGKTPLGEIDTAPRTSCQDPIPTCDKPCEKTLDCRHLCPRFCHTDECPPCMEHVDIACRCARTSHRSVCHQGTTEPPQCMRICRVTLNCGRHECGEHCCGGEKKASDRNKRKNRALDAPDLMYNGFEAEHICTRSCGRPLKCGNHTCEELCHKGRCGTCREAIFEEIGCHCGRTVLQPPLPCGTRPPPCRFACERSKACGHPQVPHNCHLDDENCPKCPFLTNKTCMCAKHLLKNQPCRLVDVGCGEICGKKLKCGSHICRKTCHKEGDCEDANTACKQACGKEKSCGHSCTEPCHSPFPCKEARPCSYKTIITCACQNLRKEVPCMASKNKVSNAKQTLDCNEECGRLERNRILAAALDLDPDTHTNDHIPYASDTLNAYLANEKWAQVKEKEMRIFAIDPDQKRLRFQPMPAPQRSFIHSLADDFGFEHESLDPEPHRHVLIFKTPKFVSAPRKTLAECARLRQLLRATSKAATTQPSPAVEQKSSNTVGSPFNSFVLTNARFALTVDELRTALKSILDAPDGVQYDISFLPSEEVVLRATSPSLGARDLDAHLSALKPSVAKITTSQALGRIELCAVDASLNITRRESDVKSCGGWSQVAAKANRATTVVGQPKIGGASSFTVLSLASRKKERKVVVPKRKESVVDDWEVAEMEEEKKESESAVQSGAASAAEESGGEGEGKDGAEMGG